MTMITDLAARKAYLLGQLNEIDGAESSLYRNRQIRKLGKEYMQVDKQLKEAYAEAEAEKSQSSVPVVSVQEGTDPAAQTVSEDEADNATSDHSSPGKVAASSSETTSKAAQRKVAFQLPEASDHDSQSEISGASPTSSSIELNEDPPEPSDSDDEEAWFHYLRARRERLHRFANDYASKCYASDHFVPPPYIGSQDEMEGSRVSPESQEQDSS